MWGHQLPAEMCDDTEQEAGEPELAHQESKEAVEASMGGAMWGHMPASMSMDVDRVRMQRGRPGMSPPGMGMGMGRPGFSPPGMGRPSHMMGRPGGMGSPGMARQMSAPNPADFTGNGKGQNNAITFEKELGKGAYGQCWKATLRGRAVAAKVTQCPHGFRRKEVDLLAKAQGQHAVELVGEEKNTPKGTVLVMGLCDSSLEALADKTRPRDTAAKTEQFMGFIGQICTGLKFLHNEARVIFGDLKPDNLLVKDGRIVFSDFGDARDGTKDYSRTNPQELGCGHPEYHCRPDVVARKITYKSDMWMLAQCAIHLWTGQAAKSNPSTVPRDIPLSQLIQRCLSSTASHRPSPEDFLSQCNSHSPPSSSRSHHGQSSPPSSSRSHHSTRGGGRSTHADSSSPDRSHRSRGSSAASPAADSRYQAEHAARLKAEQELSVQRAREQALQDKIDAEHAARLQAEQQAEAARQRERQWQSQRAANAAKQKEQQAAVRQKAREQAARQKAEEQAAAKQKAEQDRQSRSRRSHSQRSQTDQGQHGSTHGRHSSSSGHHSSATGHNHAYQQGPSTYTSNSNQQWSEGSWGGGAVASGGFGGQA